MSQIDFSEARVGVHSINHFALAVPDLTDENRFLTAFGLRVEPLNGQLLLRAAETEHVWARVVQGPLKKLVYVSLGCYEHDLKDLRTQVLEAGGQFEPPHPSGDGQGFWFRDPDHNLFQVKVAAKTQPDTKSTMADLNIPSNVRGAPARSVARTARPTRLSHLALFTSNVTQSLAFHTRALGVKLADR